MNAFYEHHQASIQFHSRCFDRLLLNATIQPFQQPERVVGLFNTVRRLYPVSRDVLRDIAPQYHDWVGQRARHWGAPIGAAPAGRRDAFVAPYFRRAKPDEVVVILKARAPARILVSIGSKATNRYPRELKRRWVEHYNVSLHDRRVGPMFVRGRPSLPFSARRCLNQHDWLASRRRERGIRFTRCGNAFLRRGDPATLQRLADALTPQDLIAGGQQGLATLIPFSTARERRVCQHRLFRAQVAYGDNLIFRRRAPLDALGERLLDANRTLGQPQKLSVIFGRKITRRHAGKLQTTIADLDLGSSVIRSHYQPGSITQDVRDPRLLRTESAN